MSEPAQPLHPLLMGVRVVEFTQAIMGPACGMILADLGAEVVHVEPPAGNPTRRLRGGGSVYFPVFCRNKQSVALDLKTDGGRQAARELARRADVLIENLGPGTLDRLGLGYAETSATNPGLVYCSLKGFLAGPYEGRHAMDETIEMMTGLAYMTGPPDRPLRAGTSVVDLTSALFGVISVLSALTQRRETGRGQLVRVGLFETSVFLMGQHLAHAGLCDNPLPPMPARASTWSVYRTFPTRDGRPLFLGIVSEKHWERFCRVFGRPDLFADARFCSNESRNQHLETLHREIEKTISCLPLEEALRLCEEAVIPFAPVAQPEDLLTDPHLLAGGRLMEVQAAAGRTVQVPRLPIDAGEIAWSTGRGVPEVGEHSWSVLRGLGYGEEAIRELIAMGAAGAARLDRRTQ